MLESKIQRLLTEAILREFKLFPVLLKLSGETGLPDMVVPLPGGRVVWLETKAANGRISPRQQLIYKRLSHVGHRVETVVSVAQALRVIKEELNV